MHACLAVTASGHIATMLTAGTLIDDKYQIISLLGTGGFGSVYKAEQQGFQRFVAVKLANPQGWSDTEALARFRREAVALNALNHNNIVGVHAYGLWHQAPYMVMEYVDAKSLQDRLYANQPLPLADIRQIMRQLCDALSYAHSNGIIHRDLKPANILLGGDSSNPLVKIIDFGLAKLTPDFGKTVQKLTEAGTALGSVLYMSPEQCTGKEIDARADIYSAGCILFHMLSGHAPFDGDHSVVVMQKHLSEPVPDLSVAADTEPYRLKLRSVVAKAMAKDCDGRYRTAAEFQADFERAISGQRLQATTAIAGLPRAKAQEKTTSRRDTLIIAASFTAVLASVLAFIYFNNSQMTASVYLANYLNVDRVDFWREPFDREIVPKATGALALDKKDHSLTPYQRYVCNIAAAVPGSLLFEGAAGHEGYLFAGYSDPSRLQAAYSEWDRIGRPDWPFIGIVLAGLVDSRSSSYLPAVQSIIGADGERLQPTIDDMVLCSLLLSNTENADESAKILQNARIAFRTEPSFKTVRQGLCCAGLYEQMGNYIRARQILERCRMMERRNGPIVGYGKMTLSLVRLSLLTNDVKSARGYLQYLSSATPYSVKPIALLIDATEKSQAKDHEGAKSDIDDALESIRPGAVDSYATCSILLCTAALMTRYGMADLSAPLQQAAKSLAKNHQVNAPK